MVKDTTADLSCTLHNDTVSFLEPNKNTVHYDFIVQPSISFNYTAFVTDMDGTGYYEGWGDRYDHPNSYFGHLARLVRVEIGYPGEDFFILPDSNVVYCENEKYFRMSSTGGYRTNDFYRVSFDCNPYKDLYIRAVMADEAGNEFASQYTVNKAIDVVSCEYSSRTVTLEKRIEKDSNGKLIKETEDVESPIWNVRLSDVPSEWAAYLFVLKQDAEGNVDKNFYYQKSDDTGYEVGYNCFYRVLLSGSASTRTSSATIDDRGITYRCWEGDWEIPRQLQVFDFKNYVGYMPFSEADANPGLWLLEDGIYNIYCVTWNPGNNSGTDYISCTGKPFTVYKGVEKPPVSAPSASDLPSDFTVSLESAGANTGKHIAHIQYPAGFTPNPNLTYVVNYSHPASGSYSALDENSNRMDFEIPTHYCTYDFKIIAYNENGQKVQTNTKQATVDYDNIRPSMSGGYTDLVFPNGVVISSLDVTDDKSGVLKKDGKIPVKYVYANEWYYENGIWGKTIDWNSDAVRTVFYAGSGNLVFPCDGQTGTILYYQVSDDNGNTHFCGVSSYISATLFEQPSLNYSNSKIQIKWPYIYSSGENAIVQYVNNTSWTTSHTASYSDITSSGENRIYAVSPSSEESNKFIRVQLWNYTQCFKTAYAYLPYLQNPETNTPEFADFMVGNRGLNVFSDKPVLVHSFWASSNLGSNVEDWLYGGVETGVVQKSGSFTYTNDRLSEIPEGKYYVTIIHFADGTMSMTEVKRKN